MTCNQAEFIDGIDIQTSTCLFFFSAVNINQCCHCCICIRKISSLNENTDPVGNNLEGIKDRSGSSPSCPPCTTRGAWRSLVAVSTLSCQYKDGATELKMHVVLSSPVRDSIAILSHSYYRITSSIAF